MKNSILLTIDVEDWFQVENFKPYIHFSDWPLHELRVEKNIHQLLNLLDQESSPNSDTGKYEKHRATFFILGWLAERFPDLVREIHERGHEVASHGYHHNMCKCESPINLKADLTKSKKLIEDITGSPIMGYRAPSFSVDNEILKIIEDCGYIYDSSYNSFAMHGRYGHVSLPVKNKSGIAVKLSDNFYELPISNLKVGKYIFPWGGGGYFRLIPFTIFRLGIRNILAFEGTYIFYMHPWEIDPEQPIVKQASPFFRFRHYINLHKTETKLKALLSSFRKCSFLNCRGYLGL